MGETPLTSCCFSFCRKTYGSKCIFSIAQLHTHSKLMKLFYCVVTVCGIYEICYSLDLYWLLCPERCPRHTHESKRGDNSTPSHMYLFFTFKPWMYILYLDFVLKAGLLDIQHQELLDSCGILSVVRFLSTRWGQSNPALHPLLDRETPVFQPYKEIICIFFLTSSVAFIVIQTRGMRDSYYCY